MEALKAMEAWGKPEHHLHPLQVCGRVACSGRIYKMMRKHTSSVDLQMPENQRHPTRAQQGLLGTDCASETEEEQTV